MKFRASVFLFFIINFINYIFLFLKKIFKKNFLLIINFEYLLPLLFFGEMERKGRGMKECLK